MAESEHWEFRTIGAVVAIALVAAALVTGSYEISHERIAANQEARLLATLHEVLDQTSHDNNLARSRISVSDVELLGSEDPVDVFIATRDGQPVGALFASIAPRGYNGPLNLLVGVAADGTITGVRVTAHNETPGLGDRIDVDKSDWILGFLGKSLVDPPVSEWYVDRDGGAFDAMTGATVTPRAVVAGVRNTLTYYERHGPELFAAHARNQTPTTTTNE